MNKIIINPHYCSQEEYDNLIDYLSDESWDCTFLNPNSMDSEEIKNSFGKVIDLAEEIINKMPQKGDKSVYCQRITLQNAINKFSYVVNGIEDEDLIPNGE